MNNKDKKLYGRGVNDASYVVRTTVNSKRVWCPFYKSWTNMLSRCYSKATHTLQPYYIGDSVCEEWLFFMNFKDWMEEQPWQGNSLVKSVLESSNTIYSPSNCAFVSHGTSSLLDGIKNTKSHQMYGASKIDSGKYVATIRSMGSTNKYLGTFDTEIGAHKAWQKAKIDSIKCYIEKQIDERVKTTLLLKLDKIQYDLDNNLETTTLEGNKMNTNLQISTTSTQTMGSLEISTMLKKRHDKVKQSIERLALDCVIVLPPLGEASFEDTLGRTVKTTEYRLMKRDSYIVVAQLSPEFTAQLVDRWQELEEQVKAPVLSLPDFNDPVAAARAWADVLESKNKVLALTHQQADFILEQEEEIKVMKPAVQWVETYVESKSMIYKFRQVAQLLNAKEKDFRAWLVACKIMYKLNGYWTCYADHRDAGMFETFIDKHSMYKTETYFTSKGFEWISNKWEKHLASQVK